MISSRRCQKREHHVGLSFLFEELVGIENINTKEHVQESEARNFKLMAERDSDPVGPVTPLFSSHTLEMTGSAKVSSSSF